MASDRIIVEIQGDVNPAWALEKVAEVIRQGRISEAAGIPHYCWVTVFKMTGLVVSTRRKRSKTSADSFVVYSQEEYKNASY